MSASLVETSDAVEILKSSRCFAIIFFGADNKNSQQFNRAKILLEITDHFLFKKIKIHSKSFVLDLKKIEKSIHCFLSPKVPPG